MNDTAPALPDGTARPVVLWGAVLVLCCACLGLRLRGIDYQLPYETHLDATVVVRQIAVLRGDVDVESAKTGNTYYPQLLGRVAALLPNPRASELTDAGAREHLARASATWRQARAVSAALSILIVLGTFLVARTFLTGGWSLVAAALVGTSLLHVVFSTQARPHGATSSFIILAVAAALRLRRRGDVSSYWLAGAMAGCAIGALHYGVFALPPLAMAFLLREKRPGRASGWWVLAGIAVIAVCVLVFYPFYFEGDRGFLRFGKVGDEATLNLSGQPLYLEKFTGEGFFVILETLWSYDPTLLFLGALGLVVAAGGRIAGARAADPGRRRDVWVVLAHIVPYVLVIGMYQQTWERFVLQLLPYPAILAAFAASRLSAGRARVAPAIALAVLVVPTVLVWKLGSVRAARDTRGQVADWIEANLAEEDRILTLPYFDLPLVHGDAALAENAQRPWASLWLQYQVEQPPGSIAGARRQLFLPIGPPAQVLDQLDAAPLEYLRDHSIAYVVLPELGATPAGPYLGAVRAALRERSAPLMRVTPARDGGSDFLPNFRIAEAELARPFVRRLWVVDCMGPPVEVYATR